MKKLSAWCCQISSEKNILKIIAKYTYHSYFKNRSVKKLMDSEKKKVTAAIVCLPSGHMFAWSPDLVEIISNNR